MKQLNVSVSISRTNKGTIHLRAEDMQSGMLVLDLEFTAEQFGNAVTGLHISGVPCEYSDSPYIGLVRQVKSEVLPVHRERADGRDWGLDEGYEAFNEREVIPLEVDGWKAIHNRDSKGTVSFNRNRFQRTATETLYSLPFERFIDPEAAG